MTTPSSQVTFATIALSGYTTLGLRITHAKVGGGQSNLRMADGTLVVQEFWSKRLITLSCSGVAPSGLKSVDYGSTHTLIVPDPDNDDANGLPQNLSLTVAATLREDHDINAGRASWTLVCEEA